MSFINPLILYTFAFLAVPLIIQFFINRKKTVLYWAAYEWMKNARILKEKRIKINEILKLLAKLLLILLLVLFVSRPVTTSQKSGNKLVIIDNTLSMASTLGEKTRLDIAKEFAETLVKKSDSPTAIYSFDGSLVPQAKLQKEHSSLAAIFEGIELAPKSASPKDFIDALTALQILDKIDTIYFISDFQKSFYQDPSSVKTSLERLNRRKKVVFIPVDNRTNLKNISIESYSISPEGFFPGHQNELYVKIKNYSSIPIEAVPVTLAVDGEKYDRTLVSLLPYEEQNIKLNLSVRNLEEHKVNINIPQDCYPLDDNLNFVISPGAPLNVLAIVKDDRNEDFEYDIFFRSALRSFCPEDYLKYARISPSQTFEEELDNYDVIITFGVPFPKNNNLTELINDYLQKNKGLISFCDFSMDQYWEGFGILNSPLCETAEIPDIKRLNGTYLDFMTNNDLDPTGITFFKHITINGDTNNSSTGKLFLKDSEAPVMIHKKITGSNIILAGYMPYPKYTDFFYNPNFVQFTMRMFWESLNRKVFNSFTGNEIEGVSIEDYDPNSIYTAVGDSGIARKMELKGTGGAAMLGTRPFARNDFFSLFRDKNILFKFGYNSPRKDSDIEPATINEFKEAIATGLTFNEKPSFSDLKSRREHWVIAVFLLFLALIFENYAHFWRKN